MYFKKFWQKNGNGTDTDSTEQTSVDNGIASLDEALKSTANEMNLNSATL